MTTYLYPIGIVVVLFVLFTVLRPRQCTGRCAGCAGASCARHEDHHAH